MKSLHQQILDKAAYQPVYVTALKPNSREVLQRLYEQGELIKLPCGGYVSSKLKERTVATVDIKPRIGFYE